MRNALQASLSSSAYILLENLSDPLLPLMKTKTPHQGCLRQSKRKQCLLGDSDLLHPVQEIGYLCKTLVENQNVRLSHQA